MLRGACKRKAAKTVNPEKDPGVRTYVVKEYEAIDGTANRRVLVRDDDVSSNATRVGL